MEEATEAALARQQERTARRRSVNPTAAESIVKSGRNNQPYYTPGFIANESVGKLDDDSRQCPSN